MPLATPMAAIVAVTLWTCQSKVQLANL